MTFWLDAQLQPELAVWIGSRFGVFVKHVRDIGLREASDDTLIAAARRLGDIVIGDEGRGVCSEGAHARPAAADGVAEVR